jgi:crossover junction endodeoxyribonuclease RusA
MSTRLRAALASQWSRRLTDKVTLQLPLPISTNDLWRPVGKGMVLSREYRTWKTAAGQILQTQRPGRIDGRYDLVLVVSSAWHGDLSNALKGIEDLLQTHGVIENDKLARRIVLEWGDGITGALVTVSAAEAA